MREQRAGSHGYGRRLAAAGLLLVASLAVIVGPTPLVAASPPAPACVQVVGTTDGAWQEFSGAMSGDGGTAVVIERRDPDARLLVRDVANGTIRSLTTLPGLYQLLGVSGNGRYVLLLAGAFTSSMSLIRVDTTSGVMLTVPTGGRAIDWNASNLDTLWGVISDDGRYVATVTGAGAPPTLVTVVDLQTSGVRTISVVPNGVPAGTTESLRGMSGDGRFLLVSYPNRPSLVDISTLTPSIVATFPSAMSSELYGRGRYVRYQDGGGSSLLYDTVTAVTTDVTGRLVRETSHDGRYWLEFTSAATIAESRWFVRDNLLVTTHNVSRIEEGDVATAHAISDNGQTVEYFSRAHSRVARPGVADLTWANTVALPRGAMRELPLRGELPVGTTMTVGGVAAGLRNASGRTIATIPTPQNAPEGWTTAQIDTPDGCRFTVESVMSVSGLPGVVQGVLHPGETFDVAYVLPGGILFPPAGIDFGEFPATDVVAEADGTVHGTVSVATSAAPGPRDVTVHGTDPDDAVIFPGGGVIRTSYGEFHPVEPARIVDTRDGTGGRTGPLLGGEPVAFPVVGVGGVPATGVAAVVVNVTTTEATAPSFLTVYPSDAARPTASNLNMVAGQTVPNLVTVRVGADGGAAVFNFAGTAHIVMDVVGWYGTPTTEPGGAYLPLTPVRLLDTRESGHPIGAQGTLRLPVSSGLPATAVALNVTITEPTQGTYLAVTPAGAVRTTSSLNATAGQTVANMVVVPLGDDNAIDIYNHLGTAHVVVDLLGIFDDGSLPLSRGQLTGMNPQRVLDTRSGLGAPVGRVEPGQPVPVSLAGVVPAAASAVVVNLTATDTTGPGFVTAWPGATAQPGTSNLNYVRGGTVPNLAVVPIGADGTILVTTGAASAHLIADVLGWYGAEPS